MSKSVNGSLWNTAAEKFLFAGKENRLALKIRLNGCHL